MYKYILVALKLDYYHLEDQHLGYFYDEYVKKRKWLDEKNTQI